MENYFKIMDPLWIMITMEMMDKYYIIIRKMESKQVSLYLNECDEYWIYSKVNKMLENKYSDIDQLCK